MIKLQIELESPESNTFPEVLKILRLLPNAMQRLTLNFKVVHVTFCEKKETIYNEFSEFLAHKMKLNF